MAAGTDNHHVVGGPGLGVAPLRAPAGVAAQGFAQEGGEGEAYQGKSLLFSEEKRSKKDFIRLMRRGRIKRGKVFWFFFSKKNMLSS
jgi:hypothetical protein